MMSKLDARTEMLVMTSHFHKRAKVRGQVGKGPKPP
jgi:hypothetical protein